MPLGLEPIIDVPPPMSIERTQLCNLVQIPNETKSIGQPSDDSVDDKNDGTDHRGAQGVHDVCHKRFLAQLYSLVRNNGKQESRPHTTISTPAWNLVE